MYKILGITAIAALLAGCADEVAEVIVPTDEIITVCDPIDPEDCKSEVNVNGGVVSIGDLQAASYNGTTLLSVQIALDGPDALQEYELVVDPDNPRTDDYQKYTFSASSLNRAYTALAGRSPNGEVTAVVVMDEGQFNRYFAGATVAQDEGSFDRPSAGTASYSGDYVGLINTAAGNEPSEVRGVVLLNANFNDKVEGSITGRLVVGGATLTDLVLFNADIKADGVFGGAVQDSSGDNVGSYGGAFGGSQAEYVGGAVSVETDTLQEYGIFVIETCGPLASDC
jgi:hypothetical protein